MSDPLIARSPDLQRLCDEGYAVEVCDGALLLRDVPYLNAEGTIMRGVLASNLTLVGDATTRPDTHVVSFAGETPCDENCSPLVTVINETRAHAIGGVEAEFTFSRKPQEGYPDYYEKMTAYVAILARGASSRDEDVTAQTQIPGAACPAPEDDDVFVYAENASARAGISAATAKLRVPKVAIVGLGGTGSYILDLIAKTPIREIHLFDGDVLEQHNAFRAPGAASLDALQGQPLKVEYFSQQYAPMRRNIVAHGIYIDERSAAELAGMDFVFVAIDRAGARKTIVERLEADRVPFIDVGMGLTSHDSSIGGQVRTTLSTPDRREHVHQDRLLPLADSDQENAYSQNVQIADLNALSATLAVIRWKRHMRFYDDFRGEHHSVYVIDGNDLSNDYETDAAPHD